MRDSDERVPDEWLGKVLYVYFRGGGGRSLESGVAIRDARFMTINGRVFLAGVALSDPDDWVADLPLLILWEDVMHVVIINSQADFFARWTRALASARLPGGDDTPQ